MAWQPWDRRDTDEELLAEQVHPHVKHQVCTNRLKLGQAPRVLRKLADVIAKTTLHDI